MDGQFPNERRRLGGGFRRLRTDGGSCQRVACLEQDEIRLGRDDGPSRAPDASGVSAASRGPFYFAWGCFRDFVSGPCGVPPKSICTASGTRDHWLRANGESIGLQPIPQQAVISAWTVAQVPGLARGAAGSGCLAGGGS